MTFHARRCTCAIALEFFRRAGMSDVAVSRLDVITATGKDSSAMAKMKCHGAGMCDKALASAGAD
jgi:hypothetical protein